MERFLSYVTKLTTAAAWFTIQTPKLKGNIPVEITLINAHSRIESGYIYHELKLLTGSSELTLKDGVYTTITQGLHLQTPFILMPSECIIHNSFSDVATTINLLVIGHYLND